MKCESDQARRDYIRKRDKTAPPCRASLLTSPSSCATASLLLDWIALKPEWGFAIITSSPCPFRRRRLLRLASRHTLRRGGSRLRSLFHYLDQPCGAGEGRRQPAFLSPRLAILSQRQQLSLSFLFKKPRSSSSMVWDLHTFQRARMRLRSRMRRLRWQLAIIRG